MSFGLKITEPPILEMDKVDWVNYKGIMMPKNTARAKKAWDTIRAKEERRSYNRIKKNEVRKDIIGIIKKDVQINSNILTMDTQEFIFTKEMNDYNFFICEHKMDTYKIMKKAKPDNVKLLHYGEIVEFVSIENNFDIIYLDFCCTFKKAEDTIAILLPKIATSKYFGFTFCLRKNKKELEDYKFDIINKVQTLLARCNGIKITSLLVYGRSYRDPKHAPMVTLLFKNISSDIGISRTKIDNRKKDCTEWLTKEVVDEYIHRGFIDIDGNLSIDFRQYENIEELLEKTGLTPVKGLRLVKYALDRIKSKTKGMTKEVHNCQKSEIDKQYNVKMKQLQKKCINKGINIDGVTSLCVLQNMYEHNIKDLSKHGDYLKQRLREMELRDIGGTGKNL